MQINRLHHNLMPICELIRASLKDSIDTAMVKVVQGKTFKTPPIREAVGKMETHTIPKTISRGEVFEVLVSLTNESSETWYGYGDKPVFLSYHWLNADGSHHIYDGVRTPLSNESLASGKTVSEVINVVAPQVQGHFELVLTLVQESVCWFEEKNFRCATNMVAVGQLSQP